MTTLIDKLLQCGYLSNQGSYNVTTQVWNKLKTELNICSVQVLFIHYPYLKRPLIPSCAIFTSVHEQSALSVSVPFHTNAACWQYSLSPSSEAELKHIWIFNFTKYLNVLISDLQ